MISSETSIYNLALNAIGARSNISSPTENSREAEVCRLWYDSIRDQILSAAAWPEATRTAYLALVNERDSSAEWVPANARPGYQFLYAAPIDCLRPQYLSGYERFHISATVDESTAIATTVEDAIFTYTSRLTNVARWSPDLQLAIVDGLAARICMPLSGKPGRAKVLADQANAMLYAARERAANASNETFEHVPDWISARGYSGSLSSTRYIYPVGSLLTVGAGVN